MSIADLMQQMSDAGAPMEAILLAVRALEAKDADIEQRKANARDRKRRQRERDRDVTVTRQSRDRDGTVTPAKEIPPNPHKKISPPIEPDGSIAPRGRKNAAHRIPADWTPVPIDDLPARARELARQWPEGAYEAEAEAHRDFWLSEGGARARKVDWPKAWQNRIVQVTASVLRAAKAGVRYAPPKPKPANTDWLARARHAEERARMYEQFGRTDDAADQRRAAQRFVQMAASPGLAAQPPPLSVGAR